MEMDLSINSDNYKILKSGTAMSFNKDSSINFACDFKEINFRFEIEFNFLDTETKELGIEKKIEDNNKIIFECKNFNNTLGTATTKVIDLATINNKKMYINFLVTKLDNSPRVLHYTFYIEE